MQDHGPAGEPESLAPGFLVAMPQLADPNFRRSLVLVTAHGADGAMGFIVNHALPATVKDVMGELDMSWSGQSSAPVWAGGPVLPESGWLLFEHAGGAPPPDSLEVLDGVFLSASKETLRQLSKRPPGRFRLLLGYAGWGPGQLESELVEGSWLPVPVDVELLFDTPPNRAWEEAFRRLGIEPARVVPGPGIQ